MKPLAFDADFFRRRGVHFAYDMQFLIPELRADFSLACDAQPVLTTVGNSGIPAMLTTFLDPSFITTLFAPMKAAQIAGEAQKGTWITDTAMFPVIESTGQTATYGDYSETGSSGVNVNYPQRQSYHYQIMSDFGERELERMGEAKLDWASKKRESAVLTLNKFQNQTYFFGVAGLQNYGLLNSPDLNAAIAVTSAWSGAAADVIFTDIIRLVKQAITQTGSQVDALSPMKLCLSPVNAINLNKTNSFNINVFAQIKINFPNMTFETAPEYSNPLGTGELVQLYFQRPDAQPVATAAYTEKLRAHSVVIATSSYKQKQSQGTWGSILFSPAFVAQMVG